MDGYQLRSEKKKKAIRQSAFELFATYGIDKVSLAEIAKKAQVSPVTIYNYFGTKDDLVRKVMTSFLEDEWRQRIELLRSDLSFPQKIKKMIFETSEWVERVNIGLFHQMLSSDPDWQAIIENIYAESIPELRQFIESGRAEGYIDKSISTNTIMLYFNLIKEMKLTSLFKDASSDPRTLDELTHLIFYGLLNQRIDA